MRLGNTFPSQNFQGQAALADVAELACADFDVLALDIENAGSGALTGFEIHGRISKDAPYRAITPASFTVQSYDVLKASATSPVALAAGGFAQFALNVSTFQSVKIRASGATAVLKINAAGYSERD